jgi:hypothetical protein
MQNNNKLFVKNPSIFRGVFCFILICLTMNGFAQSTIQFKDSKKNFGMVKKGELVKVVYEFKNSGYSPLIIYDYKVGCACTEVEFSRDPVLPGESAEILVKFDTKSAYDRQDRVIEIISNAKNNNQKIRLKGVVLTN